MEGFKRNPFILPYSSSSVLMINHHGGRSGTSMRLPLNSFSAECPFRTGLNKGNVWALGTIYKVLGLHLAHWEVSKENSLVLRLAAALDCIPVLTVPGWAKSFQFIICSGNQQPRASSSFIPARKRQSLSKKFIPWWLIKIELRFMLLSTPSIFRPLRCVFHHKGWFRWILRVLHRCWWHERSWAPSILIDCHNL